MRRSLGLLAALLALPSAAAAADPAAIDRGYGTREIGRAHV
jgi:hypothetical protein